MLTYQLDLKDSGCLGRESILFRNIRETFQDVPWKLTALMLLCGDPSAIPKSPFVSNRVKCCIYCMTRFEFRCFNKKVQRANLFKACTSCLHATTHNVIARTVHNMILSRYFPVLFYWMYDVGLSHLW